MCSGFEWWVSGMMVVEVGGDRSIRALISNKGVLHWTPVSESSWEEWEPGGMRW